MIETVVFDLDDTLYPERQYVRSGFAAVAGFVEETWGQRGFFEAAWACFEAGQRGTIFNQALHALGLPDTPTHIAACVSAYRQHEPALTLFPDADAALTAALAHFQVGVLTDGYLGVQQRKVRSLGLGERVPCVVFSDTWGRDCWKPHPRPYEAVHAHFQAAPAACVYVGDNPAKDFIGARRVGWRSVRVRRPGTEHGHRTAAPGYEADAEIADLSQLGAALSEL